MQRTIKHCNIEETIVIIQDFILNGTEEVLLIDADSLVSQRIIERFFIKPKSYGNSEGLYQEQGYYMSWPIIADHILFVTKDVSLSATEYKNLIDYAKKENKRIVILMGYAKLERIQADTDVIICHNELALTVGELISKLESIENPNEVFPVFLQDGAYFATENSNTGLTESEEFNSIELKTSELGPAISVSVFLNSLLSLPKDTVIELSHCSYPLKWDFNVEGNIASFYCWDIEQTLESGLAKIKRELSTRKN